MNNGIIIRTKLVTNFSEISYLLTVNFEKLTIKHFISTILYSVRLFYKNQGLITVPSSWLKLEEVERQCYKPNQLLHIPLEVAPESIGLLAV